MCTNLEDRKTAESTFGQNEIIAVVSTFKFDSLPSSSTEGKDQ
jgi:hypothetical protein